MKNFILLLFVLLFANTSFSQAQNMVDIFKKYSYQIMGYISPSPPDFEFINGTGSGFFIKRNNHLFFITAMHVITGCDGKTMPPKYPDLFNVLLPGKGETVTIYATGVRDTAKCLPFAEYADVIVLPVEDKYLDKVYSVEGYEYPPFKTINSTAIFGYPAVEMYKGKYQHLAPTSVLNIPIKKSKYAADSINYKVYSNYIKIDSNLRGYSGSPVFLRDAKSQKWRISGIGVGSGLQDDGKKFLYIVKIEYAYKKIEALLH